MVPKYIVPANRTKFSKVKNSVKLLELAIISAVFFQYLIKQKYIDIFAVSIRNIKYRLNMRKTYY